MPTYRNDAATAKILPGCGIVEAGETGSLLTYLDYPGDFTITEHDASPYVKLHAGTISATPITGVAKYAQVEIHNNSGDVLTVVINEDTSNQLYFVHTQIRVIENKHGIEQIELSGSGGGAVYIYGLL